jgi:hypothetical protein
LSHWREVGFPRPGSETSMKAAQADGWQVGRTARVGFAHCVSSTKHRTRRSSGGFLPGLPRLALPRRHGLALPAQRGNQVGVV